MNKLTVKVKDFPNTPQGYDTWNAPTEGDAFQRMSEELPHNSRYIKHFWRQTWFKGEGFHTPPDWTSVDKIPIGVLTYWIDVFYEQTERAQP